MDRIYAIGDIHGYLDALDHALALIEADGGADAQVVFLGDYVDRGPNSRGVIERLLEGIETGRPWTVLRGNHDRMFCRFAREETAHDARIRSGLSWLAGPLGGTATLASYGLQATDEMDHGLLMAAAAEVVPERHLTFLEERPLWLEAGPLLFVHAGIRPRVTLEDQLEDDLVWIREGFLDVAEPFDWLVVHGHTALDYPTHYGMRIDLDGGGGYGRPIIPARFEGTTCHLLTENGPELLAPPPGPPFATPRR